MASTARSMRVGIAVVLMPDRRDIPWIGLEEQLRHSVKPLGRLLADRADLIDRCFLDRKRNLDDGAAIAALEIVPGHQSSPVSSHPAQTPQMAR